MIKRELALLAQNSEDPKLQKENIHGLCLQFWSQFLRNSEAIEKADGSQILLTLPNSKIGD